MKSILQWFSFIGMFSLIFVGFGSQDAFAATTNNCLAQYIAPAGTQGVRFSLPILSGELSEDAFVVIQYGLNQNNLTSQSADFIPSIANAPDYFQYEHWGIGSPSTVYYRFMLNNQQYCPPTGFKTLSVSSSPGGNTGSGTGAGSNTGSNTGATGSQTSCPTGTTWNANLNTCANAAQTVGADPTPGIISDPTTGALSDPTPGIISDPTPEGVESTSNPRLVNPLGGVDSIEGFLEKLFNIILRIAIPIIALAIIYSGFLFVAAQGNDEKLKNAKKTLLYTLIGATIILAAWVIASALKSTVDDIRSDVGIHYIQEDIA
jgi:hypothetical protein